MNGYRESDSLIVSRKSLKKIGDNKRMAEGMEKRRLAKGNPVEAKQGPGTEPGNRHSYRELMFCFCCSSPRVIHQNRLTKAPLILV